MAVVVVLIILAIIGLIAVPGSVEADPTPPGQQILLTGVTQAVPTPIASTHAVPADPIVAERSTASPRALDTTLTPAM